MTPPAEPTDAAEAQAAVERATGKLTESYQRWPEVHDLSQRLDVLNRENHFSEKITEAFRRL